MEGQPRISESSWHGTEIIGVSMEKYQELKDRIKELETELYYCHRNNQIKDVVQKGK